MDFSKIKEFFKNHYVLILILIMALVLRVVFIYSLPVRWWDETIYSNFGYDLSENMFGYSFSDKGWTDYIPSSDWNYMYPKAGFRAPFLSYSLAMLYYFNLDFLLLFFMPIIGTISVFLLYVLGKNMFNKRIGLISAFILTIIPLHVIYSSKILTGVYSTFFIIFTFISFYKGYEGGNRFYKVIFGVFLALALLTRYTILWVIPIFLFYFLIRDKSLKFLKDKYLWLSIICFFIVMIPIFIYGNNEYGNIIGAFIHGYKASSYWGGLQEWFYYIKYWYSSYSILGIVFIMSLIFIYFKKLYLKKEVYLLLIWFLFFFIMASLMGHKEGRFILPLIPGFCLLIGLFLGSIIRITRNIMLVLIFIIVMLSLILFFSVDFNNSYNKENLCFKKGNLFMKDLEKDSLVFTDQSPIVYYYTKLDTRYFLNPLSLWRLNSTVKNEYPDRNVYLIFSEYDMPLNIDENLKKKNILDKNYEMIFECQNSTFVYKIN